MIKPDQFLKAQANQVIWKNCPNANDSYSLYNGFQVCAYGHMGYKDMKSTAHLQIVRHIMLIPHNVDRLKPLSGAI